MDNRRQDTAREPGVQWTLGVAMKQPRTTARPRLLSLAAALLVVAATPLMSPDVAEARPAALPAANPGPGGMTTLTRVLVGGNPRQPVFDSVDERLFVPDYGGPLVSVIDTATNELLTTITVDKQADAIWTAALDSARSRLFTVTTDPSKLIAIDTTTNKVKGKLAVAKGSHDIVVDSPRSQLYLFSPDAPRLQVISTRTLRLLRSIRPPKNAQSMAFDPVHGLLYFDGYTSKGGLITAISTRTWRTAFTIPSPDIGGGSMTLDIAANRLYASLIDDEDPGSMIVVDTQKRTVLADITVGMWPGEPVVDSTRHRVYLATQNDPDLAVIDTVSNTVIGHISTGGQTGTPVLYGDGHRIFATSYSDETSYLAAMDPATNTTIGMLSMEEADWRPVLDTESERAYIAATDAGIITVVDLAQLQ